ncbi:MAG: fumarylacetoacetate hydrolase family protein [Pseudomonadota bacterium]
MSFVIDPPPQPTLPIVGSDSLFPVHRIYCVGRNYAEHTREMGHDPDKEPPFFFQKNPDSLVTDGRFPYPPASVDVHFEIELIAALKSGGTDIAEADALDCVFGYALALDMTRRDLQGQAKKAGRPWEVGKAFENSAPSTALVPAETIGHPSKGEIWLDVNGERRQTGDLAQMIWSIPEQIAFLSRLFTLRPGDLIMTGTPAGVGPVTVGDALHGHVSADENSDAIPDLKVTVVAS